MSEKTLHNPHLKENPFQVPAGYFQRWKPVGPAVELRDQGALPDRKALPDQRTLPDQGALPDRRHCRIRKALPDQNCPATERAGVLFVCSVHNCGAAAFILLFGIGYLLLQIAGRNNTEQMQTEELSILSEWSTWGWTTETCPI